MGRGTARAAKNDVSDAQVRGEIEQLHIFFVEWFSGVASNEDAAFEARFGVRFDDEFILIPPRGEVLGLNELATSIRRAHGSNRDFRIAIRNVVVRRRTTSLLIATYEEWQRNARASTPPDNARVATVIFSKAPSGERLRWLHVHETSMPEQALRAGSFDF